MAIQPATRYPYTDILITFGNVIIKKKDRSVNDLPRPIYCIGQRERVKEAYSSEQDPEAQQTLAIVCCLMHQSLQISKHCLCCFFVNSVYFPL